MHVLEELMHPICLKNINTFDQTSLHQKVHVMEAKLVPRFLARIVSMDYYMARPVTGVDVCYSCMESRAVDQVA